MEESSTVIGAESDDEMSTSDIVKSEDEQIRAAVPNAQDTGGMRARRRDAQTKNLAQASAPKRDASAPSVVDAEAITKQCVRTQSVPRQGAGNE